MHCFFVRTLRSCFAVSISLGVVGFASVSWAQTTGQANGATTGPSKLTPGQPFTESLVPTGEADASVVKFDLVPIPAGKFMMGSPESEKGRKKDEGPQLQVQVDAFWMGKYEVTWTEYNLFLSNYHRLAKAGAPRIPKDQFADAVTYPTPMYELEAGPELERMGGRGGSYPAVIMSQFAARQYTKWLSKKTGHFYRLPTEAEWEYACRAGTTTAYSFGNDAEQLKDYGWFTDNSDLPGGSGGAYRKVGQKKPNPWGLYDMYGNVGEWCLDQYDADWYAKFQGKTPTTVEMTNWPTKQYPRCIRGGGWSSDPEECRSAARFASTKELNIKDPQLPQSPHWLSNGFWVGFRIISPLTEPSEADKVRYWDADDENTKRIVDTRDREIKEIVNSPAAGR